MATHIDKFSAQTDSPTLESAYQALGGNQPDEIPWIIRLLENPASPLALPGKINLHDHDCLHLLLERGTTSDDEAFVVGFTMGNDSDTQWFHVCIFKFIARFLYPKTYRFSRANLTSFDLAFQYGKHVEFKNINKLNFEAYYGEPIAKLQQLFGIDPEQLRSLNTTQGLQSNLGCE